MESMLYDIWLNNLTGIDPYLIRNLLDYFMMPENIYTASLSDLIEVTGIGPTTATLCKNNSSHTPIGKEIIKLLATSSFSIEVISKELKFSLEEIQEALFLLELEGQVQCLGGIVKVL